MINLAKSICTSANGRKFEYAAWSPRLKNINANIYELIQFKDMKKFFIEACLLHIWILVDVLRAGKTQDWVNKFFIGWIYYIKI